MAGGNGSLFWPITRNWKPKQFLDLYGTGKSSLQMTFERFRNIVPEQNIMVITAAKYERLVKEQLPLLQDENLLLEPYGRNTSACIAYSTYALLKRNKNAIMIVTPSDHIIPNDKSFTETMTKAIDYTDSNNVLMTIGITPDKPDTNYGYIQVTGGKDSILRNSPTKVKTFTEKPDMNMAKVFFDSGEFFWNSGIYLWKAGIIEEEMNKYIPEITGLFSGWENEFGSADESAFLERAYSDCENISIDYSVMEKTDRAWVYPARFKWSDIGTWESLYKNLPEKDKSGNAFNSYKHISENDRNCMVISSDKKKLLAVNGLDNYIVIDTNDVLLICPKNDKKIKEFTARLAMPDFEEFR
jgi:mannose-1-phosphate guanylyltransferase